MPTAAVARATARQAVAALRDREPALLRAFGADLGDALEQQLFFALRDDRRLPRGALAGAVRAARGGLAGLGATAASAIPRRRPALHPIAILVRDPIHLETVRALERELGAGGPPIVALLTARAGAEQAARGLPGVRLETLLDPALSPQLLAFQARVLARLTGASHAWESELGSFAAEGLRAVAGQELPRIGLAAFALSSGIRRLRPSLLVAFDEVGTWARILPALARLHGIGSLDVPHAEASDVEAIRGAGYDRMAVYGPRAAAVLRQAGIEDRRIVEVGAPRFDELAGRPPASPEPAVPRRLVFAAQYPAGALTLDALRRTFAGAVAAAERGAPAELVVRPHPAGPAGTIAAMVDRISVPDGVTLRVDAKTPLHDLLDGAWLLVTAWSNSVFEAALLGVPALSVVPAGVADPMRFSDEGLAIGAATPDEAAAAAAVLLAPQERSRSVERSRMALVEHIGVPDGRAAARVAALMASMAPGGAA